MLWHRLEGPSPARQQPLTPGRSCQPELICDLLDVIPLKPTLLPGTAVSSALLLGLPCWLHSMPGLRNEEGLDPLGERASVVLGFSEVRDWQLGLKWG